MSYKSRKKYFYIFAFVFLIFNFWFLILAPSAHAVSSVELFPSDFEQTINLHAGDPRVIIARLINAVLMFLGVIAVVLIMYGGFVWMTAAGNEEKITKAKKILSNAAIGLVLILSSFVIARFIIGRLVGALQEAEVGYQAGSPSIPSSLPPGAFVVKGISPSSPVPIRNVVARVVLNKAPDPATLHDSVVVTKKANNESVTGKLEISGQTIKFIPDAPCPEPNQDRKCFEAEEDFRVEVKTTLKSADGKSLTCGGLAPKCEAEFRTGSLVDVSSPEVVLIYPNYGQSVPVDSCVKMQARVRDDSGISSVEFYADGALIENGTVAPAGPYLPGEEIIAEIDCWDTTGMSAPSTHFLQAKVYDIDENEASSRLVKAIVRSWHCFNEVKDDDEDGVDCDNEKNGPSGCGLCDGASCDEGSDCASGICDETTKTCVSLPTIIDISPGDGKAGTFVTISGRALGAGWGRVIFTDGKEASPPAQCGDPAGQWSLKQVVVEVPDEAEDGPIELCTAEGLCDSSNDERGPIVPTRALSAPPSGSFDVNDMAYPGLCRAYSPTPSTDCGAGSPPQGISSWDEFCQNQNKDVSGNSDKSAYCHTAKNICVFPKGRWHSPVYLEGQSFGKEGYINWGLTDPKFGQAKVWQSLGYAETTLPPLKYGTTRVQVVATASPGIPSNPVNYEVLSPDAGTLPVIEQINGDIADDDKGGVGAAITIKGRNFGATVGIVWFVAPDGRVVQADTSLNPACLANNDWWKEQEITVKIPKIIDINDLNRDGSRSDILYSGNYKIYLRRYDSAESNKKDFAIVNEPLAPSIHCLIPSSGPNFINLTVYGEYFGSFSPKPGSGKGVIFSEGKLATLTNIGAPKETCPTGGWSDKKICVQAPAGAITGNVVVRSPRQCEGVDCPDSNGVNFTIGSCGASPTITQDNQTLPNPAYAACRPGAECCPDGSCAATGQCSTIIQPKSAFGWEFTTSPAEIVPRVIEECAKEVTDTTDLSGRFPSPSPAMLWSKEVCLNAQVAVRFNAAIDPASLTYQAAETEGNVILEKCAGGAETENLFSGGDFESLPGEAGLTGFAGTGLTLTRVAAPQDDLPDDGQEAENTTHALRLEKIEGGGEPYTDLFAAKFEPGIDAYGKSYKLSVKVKAAKTADGRFTSIGQKAGILLRKYKTDGEIETEQIVETSLKEDEWREVSVSVKFAEAVGTVEIRLFLTSPPADTRVTDYHKYAAYFDDLRLTSLDTIVCSQADNVNAALVPQPNNNAPTGFTLMPAQSFEANTWYRVTLRKDIKAKDAGGMTGTTMKEDAAKCGAGNAYCWLFKTGEEKCKLKDVWVLPNPYTVKAQFERIDYSALPGAAQDACITLNPAAFGWGWSSSDSDKAAIDYLPGRACVQNADCPIGPQPVDGVQGPSCLNNHCSLMPWTATITAMDETISPDHVLIKSQATDPGPPQITAEGSGKLYIQFVDPKVINYWPFCGSACLNAGIGAEFNLPMNSTTLTTDNIKLYEISCGNGKVDSGEDCDDGNTRDGDGCSASCLNEGANFTNQCGNGVLNYGEDCDDGKIIDGDGCSSKCLNEGVSGAWTIGDSTGICGNGVKESVSSQTGQTSLAGTIGEECDDANIKDGDGCSAKCLNEGTRSDIPVCGNGRIEKGEECEKVGDAFPDWCNANTCLRKGSDETKCGNGKIDPGEECDDNSLLLKGDINKQNLCADNCLWTGTLKPTAPGRPGCGNGKVELGEDCDDGNTKDGDGCSSICLNEGGVSVNDPSLPPACGNGQIEPGEDCDDGNTKNGDGCSSRCLNEGTSYVSCGNGIKEQGEDCDWKIFEPTYGADLAKLLCNPADCKNTGALTEAQKNQFTSAGKTPPGCGNGKLEDGEDCDTADPKTKEGCRADCTNKGRPESQISIVSLNYSEGSISDPYYRVTFNAEADLNLYTPYRVVITKDVKSQSNKNLTGLNYAGQAGLTGTPNAFSWLFTTKGERCAVDRVEVSPSFASLYVIGAKQNYQSIPWSKPDECSAQGQRLTNISYGWEWSSGDIEVASVTNQDIMPSCGNGIVEAGEDCDDNNTVSGDGCKGASTAEKGCTWEGSDYTIKCGNNHIDLGEDCDPPDPSGLICAPRCLSGPMRAAPLCLSPDQNNCCGNGRVESEWEANNPDKAYNRHEECDDGNFIAGDGCSPFCAKEGSFAPLCGNGVIDTFEECDYGTAGNWMGCDKNTCLFTGAGSASCGNGKIEYGENCDDRNVKSGDGCSAICLIEGSTNQGAFAIDAPNPNQPNMGVDPRQQAEAKGIKKYCQNPATGQFNYNDACLADNNCPGSGQPTDFTQCRAPRFWAAVDIKANVANVQVGDEASLNQGGAGELTVYCGRKDDKECASAPPSSPSAPNWSIGRGDDTCCYARPRLSDQSAASNFCPNGVLSATFTAFMDPASLPGNFILARKVNDAFCPAGAVPIDEATGEVIALVENGSFEEALIKRDADGKILYQQDDPNTTIDERTLPQVNSQQAEGWKFVTGQDADGKDIVLNQNQTSPAIRRQGAGAIHYGGAGLYQNYISGQTGKIKAKRQIYLDAGVNYRLSAFYKVASLPSAPADYKPVRLSVRLGDIFEKYYEPLIASADLNKWKVFYVQFSTPRSDFYTIELISQAQIGIYWDDVSLETLGTASPLSENYNPTGYSYLKRGITAVINFFRSIFSIASAQTPAGIWCAGEVSLETFAEPIDISFPADNVPDVTRVSLKPSRMLERRADYRLIIRGDRNLEDEIKEGVLSFQGVALNADETKNGGILTRSWTFKTRDKICALDKVEIGVDPPAAGTGAKTFIKKAGAKRDLTAYACSLVGATGGGGVCEDIGGQEIQAVTGYDWDWSWNDSDTNNDLSQLTDTTPSAFGKKILTAKNKNGQVVVTATAAMKPDNTVSPPSPGESVSGTKTFTIFICERPWQGDGDAIYDDLEFAPKGNSRPTNFSTMYCLDAGDPTKIDDDLPEPSETPPPVLIPPLAMTTSPTGQTSWTGNLTIAAVDSKARVLKEFLFPYGKDIIGIRVMENPKWLSPLAWYRDQGFIGSPQPLAEPIDGYQAIQDGTTVYIAAVNQTSGGSLTAPPLIYSNVYLISYNADASAEVKNIRDQMVKNFRLNINLTGANSRTCQNDANIGCSKDTNCFDDNNNYKGPCQAEKDKLLRDVWRAQDLVNISAALKNYKDNRQEYPRLEAGTYIRGITNSRWLSWSEVLSNALGVGLPDDPSGVGLYKCEGEDYIGFAKETCWNPAEETFKCPPGSQIYQYQNLGPNSFKLYANFEHETRKNRWAGFQGIVETELGGELILDHCPSLSAVSAQAYSSRGYCGDGRINCLWNEAANSCRLDAQNRVQYEICERGQTKTEACSFAGTGKRCLKNPNKGVCSADTQCQLSAEGCSSPDKKCVYNLGVSCSADKDCPFGAKCESGACKFTTSAKTAAGCSNPVNDCEKLDTGPCVSITGSGTKTQQCSDNCLGWEDVGACYITSYCGNGRVETGEQCDDGLLNGLYGKCKKDCSGLTAYCGDGEINGPEKCDHGTANGAYGKCRADCSGIGERCGDNALQTDYETCDPPGSVLQIPGFCSTTLLKSCKSNADCPSGETCKHYQRVGTTTNTVDGSCPKKQACSGDKNTTCATIGAPCPSGKGICTEYEQVMNIGCQSNCGRWLMSGCVIPGETRCGNGIKEGTEECDDGNDDDADGCTSDCRRPRCGDGKVQNVKLCLAGDEGKKWQKCDKDGDCGKGGKCQAPETCDLGAANNTPCAPVYGFACSFCDNNCQKAVRQGPFCGDKTKNGPEVCDWLAGTNQNPGSYIYTSLEHFDPTKEVCRLDCGYKCPPIKHGQKVCLKGDPTKQWNSCDADTDCGNGGKCDILDCPGPPWKCTVRQGIVDSAEQNKIAQNARQAFLSDPDSVEESDVYNATQGEGELCLENADCKTSGYICARADSNSMGACFSQAPVHECPTGYDAERIGGKMHCVKQKPCPQGQEETEFAKGGCSSKYAGLSKKEFVNAITGKTYSSVCPAGYFCWEPSPAYRGTDNSTPRCVRMPPDLTCANLNQESCWGVCRTFNAPSSCGSCDPSKPNYGYASCNLFYQKCESRLCVCKDTSCPADWDNKCVTITEDGAQKQQARFCDSASFAGQTCYRKRSDTCQLDCQSGQCINCPANTVYVPNAPGEGAAKCISGLSSDYCSRLAAGSNYQGTYFQCLNGKRYDCSIQGEWVYNPAGCGPVCPPDELKAGSGCSTYSSNAYHPTVCSDAYRRLQCREVSATGCKQWFGAICPPEQSYCRIGQCAECRTTDDCPTAPLGRPNYQCINGKCE